MNKNIKFVAVGVTIVGAVAWLAISDSGKLMTYHTNISDLGRKELNHAEDRLRISGVIEKGSIRRRNGKVEFLLRTETQMLSVMYTGAEPLQDTFRDGAYAFVDGNVEGNGMFHAFRVMAPENSTTPSTPRPAPH